MLFKNGDRIVFAGDSVTDMGSAQPVGEGLFDSLGFGYVRMVENLLGAWYPEQNIRVTNSGTNGNTSRDLLSRFHRDVVELKPDWVSICIGINDVWRQFDTPALTEQAVQPEEYRSNLVAMLEELRGKVKGVFLMTPYIIEGNRADAMRARIDTYCGICRELAEQYGCIFVDLQQMFENYCKVQHSGRLAWDRIHPNQIGAMMIAREFLSKAGFDYNR